MADVALDLIALISPLINARSARFWQKAFAESRISCF